MSPKEAYIEGFCKTAEAYGVDPEQLIKSARPYFETGGWSPTGVTTNMIPYLVPPHFSYSGVRVPGMFLGDASKSLATLRQAGSIIDDNVPGHTDDLTDTKSGKHVSLRQTNPYRFDRFGTDPREVAYYDALQKTLESINTGAVGLRGSDEDPRLDALYQNVKPVLIRDFNDTMDYYTNKNHKVQSPIFNDPSVKGINPLQPMPLKELGPTVKATPSPVTKPKR